MKKNKLVIAENGSSVYIYDATGSGNSLVQTITLNETNWIKTHLEYYKEDDDEAQYYLTIWSPLDSYVLVYRENNNQFYLYKTFDFNDTQVNDASVSAKFDKIGISTADYFFTYEMEEDMMQNESVSPLVHLFDHHFATLILASDNFRVYSLCGYGGDYYYDQNEN